MNMPYTLPLWQHLTTTEAADLADRDPVAILPLGAIEQHGAHLPLSTDHDIGMGLLREAFRHLPEDFPALVLPPMGIGASEEHVHFPGTLSLPAERMLEVIADMGAALHRTGVRRLVLHNSHGGNRQVMDLAGLRLRRAYRMLVVKCTYMRFPPPDDAPFPADELRHGLHGGALETALMLHLHPDRVRVDHLRNARSLGQDLALSLRRLGPEDQASFAWLAEDLNPGGVVGDATLATAEAGARLTAHYGRALAEVVRDARDFMPVWFDQERG